MEEVEIQIEWTDRAKADLNKIYNFETEVQGEEKAWNLILHLMSITEDALRQKIDPGVVDIQFSHLGKNYRKLLEGNHKITYRKESQVRYVIRVFDMRQHPDKNK